MQVFLLFTKNELKKKPVALAINQVRGSRKKVQENTLVAI